MLAPVAVGVLIWLGGHGRDRRSGTDAPLHPLLLASSGIATAIPLLLFAAAARRVPLVTIGLLQFVTPVLQLLCGVLLLGEVMTTSRWVGFGIVWVALALLAAGLPVVGPVTIAHPGARPRAPADRRGVT